MSEVAADVNSAESSPAAGVEPAISELTPSERQQWRKSGAKPTRAASSPTTATPNADSSPAALADPGASTDASPLPASEPGTPTKKAKNAESRKPELDAEIQERLTRRRQLEQEIAEYEAKLKQVKPADQPAPGPSAPSEKFPEFEEWLALPGNESKGLGAYSAAQWAFLDERKQAAQSVHQAKVSRFQTYQSRLQAETKDDPQWQSKVSPQILAMQTIDQLPPGQPMAMSHIVAQEIVQSPVPYAVQRYLTDHPDQLQGLLRETVPADVIRWLAGLSAHLSPTTTPPAPVVKTTSDAPPPPPQLGTRPHTPDADELLTAARSGDPRRYKEAANAADIARMRARGYR
jgi:hypothetical protein